MKDTVSTTAELTEKDVKQAVREYLERRGYTVEKVTTNLGTKTTGYGTSERDETVFEGMSAKVTKSNQTTKNERQYRRIFF